MRRAISGAAALLLCGTAAASAQDARPSLSDAGAADRGRLLAEAWCSGCHVVGPDQPGGDIGPAFPTVANREGQTPGGITAWLFEPHPPMPDLKLSPAEFRDLAAYVMSLREE